MKEDSVRFGVNVFAYFVDVCLVRFLLNIYIRSRVLVDSIVSIKRRRWDFVLSLWAVFEKTCSMSWICLRWHRCCIPLKTLILIGDILTWEDYRSDLAQPRQVVLRFSQTSICGSRSKFPLVGTSSNWLCKAMTPSSTCFARRGCRSGKMERMVVLMSQ